MYLGSNSFLNKRQVCNKPIVFQNFRIHTCFLIKGEMIADLQDAGKTPDKEQRFTIRKIIEDK